jgi:hypothetical protein
VISLAALDGNPGYAMTARGISHTPIRDRACSAVVDPVDFAAVAPVAQLDRALRFERSGRRFESVRARQSINVYSADMGLRHYAPGYPARNHALGDLSRIDMTTDLHRP